MANLNVILVGIFSFIVLLVVIVWFVLSRKFKRNVSLIQKVLSGKVKRPFFTWLYTIIEGQYRGKTIVCKFNFLAANQNTGMIVTIHSPLDDIRRPIKSFYKPITDYTMLWGNKVHFNLKQPGKFFKTKTVSEAAGWLFKSKRFNSDLADMDLSEKDLIMIFDELVKAVEIVRANPEKYTK